MKNMSEIIWLQNMMDMNLLEVLPFFKRIKDKASKQKDNKTKAKSSEETTEGK